MICGKNKVLPTTCGNISVGKEAQCEWLAISTKFVTAERNAISNAARKYTAAVGSKVKKKKRNTIMTDKFTTQKKIIMLFLFMIPLSTLCQNVKVEKDSTTELPVIQTNYTSDSTLLIIDDSELFVDFPGGEKAMNRFINKNLSYPQAAIKNKIEGLVYVNFTIDCNGKISNIKIVKGSNPYLDNEVIRLISIMPDWIWNKKIEMKNRRLAQRTLPINFKL